MVMGIKQAKYTTEDKMLRRLYNGAHFGIISTH